jgi:MoaA/NifB/PqqE/SkfB family radical SAM enzyme
MIPRLRDLTSGARTLLGILSARRVFSGPRSIALAISDVCNTHCLMCWDHSPLVRRPPKPRPGEKSHNGPKPAVYMDPAVFETIIRESRDLGTFRIVLCGHGDPALHPQFDRMLQLLESLDMEPYVLTNGISVDESRARLWAATRARFRFSLHAGDADTWLRVHPTSTAAQYDRLLGVIRTLSAAGRPGVSTMHVLHRANFRNLRAMVEQAHSLGIKEVLFRPVRAEGELAQLVLNSEEEAELRLEMQVGLKLSARYGIRTNLAEYLGNNLHIRAGVLQTWPLYRKMPCYLGWIYAEFDRDGTVRPCINSEIVMGKAGEARLQDIWHSPRYWSFRRESRSLPAKNEPVTGCQCRACLMSKYNANIYNLLHLQSWRFRAG